MANISPAFWPIIPPPPGQVSNFIDSPSRGYLLTAIGSVVLALQILFFSLRMYSRMFVARKLRWDDLTCTIGFLFTLAFYIICILGVRTAYIGHHLWDVSVQQYMSSNFFILQLLIEIINPAALGFIKGTFFLFYWQLFSIKQWTRIAILIGGVSSTLFYLICIAVQLQIGLPRRGQTLFEHSTKIANNEKLFVIPQAAFSVFFDLYILVLPVWSVFQLQLSFKRAIGVSMVFLTGILACVCSIISLYYRVRLEQTEDIFWILPIVLLTSLVEMQTGIICCCMPTLPFLVRHAKKANTQNSRNNYVSSDFGTGKSGWRGDQNVTITGNSQREYAMDDVENTA